MKKFLLFAALLPGTVFGAINGEWHATVEATNTTTHKKHLIGIYAKLSDTGGTLTGTAGTQSRMVAITNASESAGQLTFSIAEEQTSKPQPVRLTVFNLTESGSNLVGTVTLFNHEKLAITMVPLVVTSKH